MKTRPTEREIEKEINSLLTVDLPEGELDDIVQAMDDFCGDSYSQGEEDGAKEYEEDNPPVNEEKLCTEYATTQFADCKTLADFTEKYNEIRNLSYTYMR